MPIYSYDVFDTCLSRSWYRPADVFLAAAEKLRHVGLVTCNNEEWATSRCKAELVARSSSEYEEVDLKDIYKVLSSRWSWDEKQQLEAISIEIQCEADCIRPIATICAEVSRHRAVGDEVIFTSDTYFDADFVRDLLNRNGYGVQQHELFVSSELRKTKRTGSLFLHLKDQYRTSITHTGDNWSPDILKARGAGLTAVYFRAQEPNRYEKALFDQPSYDLRIRSAYSGAARSTRLLADASNTVWQTAANVAGPLLFSYVLWIIQESQKRGIKRLFFIARDGQILQRIARMICDWLNLDVDCRYIFASRESLFLASIDEYNESTEKLVREILSVDTTEVMASKLDLSLSMLEHHLGRLGLKVPGKGGHLNPDEIKSVVEGLCTDDEFRSLILNQASQRRALLVDYLKQERFGEQLAFALVDVGWKGRLQQALTRVMATDGELRANLPLTGFYFGLSQEAPPSSGDFVLFTRLNHSINGVLIECFCAADHGTTRLYRRLPNGRVEAVYDAENESAEIWGLKDFQDAVCQFCAILLTSINKDSLNLEELGRYTKLASMKNFNLFVTYPSVQEAKGIGSFGHSEGQGSAAQTSLAPKLEVAEIVRWLCGRKSDRREVTFWPEASLVLSASNRAVAAMYLKLWRLRLHLSSMATRASRVKANDRR